MSIWSGNYTVSHRLVTVDPDTWSEGTSIEFESASVDYKDDGTVSASFTLFEDVPETWVRLYSIGDNGYEIERADLFTGMLEPSKRKVNGYSIHDVRIDEYSTRTAKAYGPLRMAEELHLSVGWWAPLLRVPDTIGDLVRKNVPRALPVSVDGDAALSSYIIAARNETCFSMASTLASKVSYRMKTDGRGSISVEPIPNEPSALIDLYANDVIFDSINDELNITEVPNLYRVSDEMGNSFEYRTPEDSPFSVESRGRIIDVVEDGVVLESGDTLASYARAKLEELQAVHREISYTRDYIPGIYPGDILEIRCPEISVDGLFRVVSQTIVTEKGLGVEETVTEVVV